MTPPTPNRAQLRELAEQVVRHVAAGTGLTSPDLPRGQRCALRMAIQSDMAGCGAGPWCGAAAGQLSGQGSQACLLARSTQQCALTRTLSGESGQFVA